MSPVAFVAPIAAAATGTALRRASVASRAQAACAPALHARHSACVRLCALPAAVAAATAPLCLLVPPGGGGGGGRPTGWSPWRGGGEEGDSGQDTPAPIPFAARLARSSSFGAAFLGWGISSLLNDRGSVSGDLTKDDLREAAHVGLFGLVLHGVLGTIVYTLLDDTVSGSTPIPVAIKTCVDALLFLPFLANAHDVYCDRIRAGNAGKFMQSIRSHNQSAVEILRRRVIWVPAQAISFLLLPAWWRVGYTSFVMAALSVLRVIGLSETHVANVDA